MNHTTDHTEIEDIYDAIQTGEIPSVKLGDTINNAYIIVDSIGNFATLQPNTQYYIFTETIRNNRTGRTFSERYVAPEQVGLKRGLAHLEVVHIHSIPLNLTS